MLPQEVVGRYRRYKRGTRKLVYWLVRTVSECGDLEAILDKLPERRKQSSKKGKKKKDRNSAVELAEIALQTSQLTRLAEEISKAEPPARVPDYIISTAREVIAGRDECHVWYSSQALADGSDVEEQNDTHSYFIQKLKHVLELLLEAQSRLPDPQAVDSRDYSRKDDPEGGSLKTTFEWLSVDEPSENALGDEPPAFSVKTSSGAARVTVSIPQEAYDDTFQTWCFLQDLNDVRRFVVQTWKRYTQGEISFMNASMVTDTAFGLLRRSDEDFTNANPSCSTDWEALVKYLGISYFVRDNIAWLYADPERGEEQSPQSGAQINIAELLCPVAYICLDHYRSTSESYCQAQQRESGAKGTEKTREYTGASIGHEMSFWLWQVVNETHVDAHRSLNSHMIFDEFCAGLSHVHRTSSIPMWIVTACQTNMDIHDLLGEHSSHGVELVRDLASSHVALQDELDAYHEQSLHGLEDVKNGMYLLSLGVKIAGMANSQSRPPLNRSDSRTIERGNGTREGPRITYKDGLFPASAGGALLDDRLSLYMNGLDIMPHGAFVLLMAHLYCALVAMGPLKATTWPDMDFVLSSFGTNQPLVADPSAEYDEKKAARHLFIDLGVSAKAFAKDLRSKMSADQIRRRGIRNMTITSPLLLAFYDGGMIQSMKYKLAYSRTNSVEAMLRGLLDSKETNPKPRSAKRASSGAGGKKTCYTPVDLLKVMCERLRDDEPTLNFDFIRFTLSCSRLIQDICRLVPCSRRWERSDQSIPFFESVLKILHSPPPSELVEDVAKMIRAHIDECGSRYVQEARSLSSGTLSDDRRPDIEPLPGDVRQARAALSESLDQSNTKYTFSGVCVGAYNPDITADIAGIMQDPTTENPLHLLTVTSTAAEAA